MRKRFSPEFLNRIDVVITYQPLDETSLSEILDHHIAELQRHVHTRLGERSFEIEVTPAARKLLLEKGASQEFGARELKRTIHRMLTQPLAALVADGEVERAGRGVVDLAEAGDALQLRPTSHAPPTAIEHPRPVVLAVDDNAHLVAWLERLLADAGVTPLTAASAQEARDIAGRQRIDLVLIDLLASDGDGLWLAFELLRLWPQLQVVLMTGTELSPDEAALCDRQDFPVLRKPFLAQDVLGVIHARLLHSSAVGR